MAERPARRRKAGCHQCPEDTEAARVGDHHRYADDDEANADDQKGDHCQPLNRPGLPGGLVLHGDPAPFSCGHRHTSCYKIMFSAVFSALPDIPRR